MRKRLREMALHNKVSVHSAGTRAGQLGRKPDIRVQRVADAAGVSLARIKSSQATIKDLVRSDWVLAMDGANLADLLKMCPAEHQHKLHLLMTFSGEPALTEVPDPYYGNAEGFAEVYRLIDGAQAGLVRRLVREMEQ